MHRESHHFSKQNEFDMLIIMTQYFNNNKMRHYSYRASIAVSPDHSSRRSRRQAKVGPHSNTNDANPGKTRSIAIKRTRQTDSRPDYEDETDSTEYEMATWRMYNRIINHRASQNDGLDSGEDKSVTGSSLSSSMSFLPYKHTADEFIHAPENIRAKQNSKIQELDQMILEMEDDEDVMFQLDL